MNFHKQLEDETVYRGHKIEVWERADGGHEISSNILGEPIEIEPRFIVSEHEKVKAAKIEYVKGYIDGWKDQGGP